VCNPCFTSSICGTFGAPSICGVVTAFTPAGSLAGSVTVNGVTYSIPPGTVFSTNVVVGGSFCFLFNTSNLVTGCLAFIPTGLTGMENVRHGNKFYE
jgi:hypothetical protein